jgi:hypothetical protein
MRERYRTVPGVKERLRQTCSAWRKANPERRKETDRERYYSDYQKTKFRQIRRKCMYEGIPFDLELEDFEIPKRCPVLGIPLVVNRQRGRRPDGIPSVDRIDPTKGYVKGNVKIISERANRLKQDASLEELEALVRYVSGSSGTRIRGTKRRLRS